MSSILSARMNTNKGSIRQSIEYNNNQNNDGGQLSFKFNSKNSNRNSITREKNENFHSLQFNDPT